MANYNLLKKAVAEIVKKNGRQEITGENLQATLFGVIDSIGKYATYAGVAKPLTDPKTPDQNVFYLATQGGRYEKFGVDVPEGLSVIYAASNGWGVDELFTFERVATKDDIAALRADIERELTGYLTIESASRTYATKTELAQSEKTLQDNIDTLAEEHRRDVGVLNNEDELLHGEIESTNTEVEGVKGVNAAQQKQIDALISRSDVVDVVANKAALNAYDISTITINDVIKVLKDESRNDEITYYRLVRISPKEWKFIGSLGEVYTKEEANATFLTPRQGDVRYMERDAVVISEVVSKDLTQTSTQGGELVYNEKSGKLAAKVGGKYYISSSSVEMSGEYPQFGRIYKTADRLFIGTINGLSELNKSTITNY